jgi:calmodulin
MFDTNRNGTISVEELVGVLRSMGQDPTAKELAELMTKMDKDGSGEIDFDEFLAVIKEE